MSLNTSLSIAVSALNAFTGAVDNTSKNIANASTPGYTRKMVVLSEAAVSSSGTGGGVVLQGYQAVRDEILQSQIQGQTQQQSNAQAQANAIQQVQTAFTTSTQDIATRMSALFSSISALSTNPANTANRQSVLSSAQSLATAFNTTSASITSQQASLNTQVATDVTQINSLAKQIAALNPSIALAKQTGADSSADQDKQDALVLSLSKLTNVAVTHSDNGITLTTGSGTALVVGANSFALQTTNSSGSALQVLDVNGKDVTSSISGGDLGGAITMRDGVLASLTTKLDTLASQFGTAMNQAQSAGFDLNGNAGQKLFNLPATSAGAAASISVAISNPSLIAASADGTAGSGGNVAAFAAVQTSNLPSGQTPIDTYASLVFSVGNIAATANADVNAATASLTQLEDQRNSTSGVSIDEESVNLIAYQQAYAAAARVVSTIQTLFQVTLSMGT
jgi:flagellar hook-associated protein 1 FlgK